ESDLRFNEKRIAEQKERLRTRIKAVIQYVTTKKYRSNQLLEYFGEKTDARCGKCDVCIDRNEVNVSTLTFDYIVEDLKKIIGEQPASIHEILQKISVKDEQQIRNVIKFLLDNQKIVYVNGAQLMWHKKE
ncbi:MAG: RecQ family zinc-binding domain-containing protein, partial [Bacteroidales bacterium]|nr:RecQ family zinc-binding domain-containing protein [Bacteroidales bacterium]